MVLRVHGRCVRPDIRYADVAMETDKASAAESGVMAVNNFSTVQRHIPTDAPPLRPYHQPLSGRSDVHACGWSGREEGGIEGTADGRADGHLLCHGSNRSQNVRSVVSTERTSVARNAVLLATVRFCSNSHLSLHYSPALSY